MFKPKKSKLEKLSENGKKLKALARQIEVLISLTQDCVIIEMLQSAKDELSYAKTFETQTVLQIEEKIEGTIGDIKIKLVSNSAEKSVIMLIEKLKTLIIERENKG